jgi:hypothetical protein
VPLRRATRTFWTQKIPRRHGSNALVARQKSFCSAACSSRAASDGRPRPRQIPFSSWPWTKRFLGHSARRHTIQRRTSSRTDPAAETGRPGSRERLKKAMRSADVIPRTRRLVFLRHRSDAATASNVFFLVATDEQGRRLLTSMAHKFAHGFHGICCSPSGETTVQKRDLLFRRHFVQQPTRRPPPAARRRQGIKGLFRCGHESGRLVPRCAPLDSPARYSLR